MSENSKKTLKIQDLYDNFELYKGQDDLSYLLNQDPPKDWIAVHPHIKSYKYLPIDKIEYLLRQIFKIYSIEILREGHIVNGVYCVVRVHYKDPLSDSMKFHDGIGATELQTKSGKSNTDMASLSSGAISMAFPIAKTVAIKDACDHFGRLFGADLNRKDLVTIKKDEKLNKSDEEVVAIRVAKHIKISKTITQLEQVKNELNAGDGLAEMYEEKMEELVYGTN